MKKPKVGRDRRQDVDRDSEGRIAASEYRREDVRTLAQWNRLRDIAAEMMMDERLTTQWGKLFYNRLLNAAQFEALNRWAAMLNDYDRIKLGLSRSPPSPSLEARSPGESNSVLSSAERSFLDRFYEARRELMAAGMAVEYATNRLCRNEGAGLYLAGAIKGADILAAHFGLTGARKRA